jgi:hypothetical protein
MSTIGYMLANYKKFGDDALKAAHNHFYELGKSIGQNVKKTIWTKYSSQEFLKIIIINYFPRTSRGEQEVWTRMTCGTFV